MKQTTDKSKSLTINDVATKCNRTPEGVLYWISSGCRGADGERRKLRAVRDFGRWRILESDLEDFVLQLNTPPAESEVADA
ncbi:MAG: helix-turn-helix domain-containing protein [Planctomycetota bacterium]